jgi:hypothetical protein
MSKVTWIFLIVLVLLVVCGTGALVTRGSELIAPNYQGGTTTATPTSTSTRTAYGATATPTTAPATATITPTPDSSLGPRVVEIYPCQGTGTAGQDWNLRSGCGNDDLYVRIGNFALDDLNGYSIAMLDASDIEVCRYTFADYDITDRLKTIYLDQMLNPSGQPCVYWPVIGKVVIYEH